MELISCCNCNEEFEDIAEYKCGICSKPLCIDCYKWYGCVCKECWEKAEKENGM